jgi:hypothetical protein
VIDPWLSPGHMLQVPTGEMVLVGSPPRLTWATPGMTADDAAKVTARPGRHVPPEPPHALDEADRP